MKEKEDGRWKRFVRGRKDDLDAVVNKNPLQFVFTIVVCLLPFQRHLPPPLAK